MATIALDGLVKRYGKTHVVHGIDLQVKDGEFVVLVGPPAVGSRPPSDDRRARGYIEGLFESTAMSSTARAERAEHRDGVPELRDLPPYVGRQNIALVFTPASSTAPEKKKRSRMSRVSWSRALLERRPSAAFRRQARRVAIGRAMVRTPTVYFSISRSRTWMPSCGRRCGIEIKKLHQRLGTTIVFVTHDQVEAMTMADRIVVMRDGHILQVGTPMELYDNPADVFTARFIGSPTMNLIPATLRGQDGHRAELNGLSVSLPVPSTLSPMGVGSEVLVGVRPHDFIVDQGGSGEGLALKGEVSSSSRLAPRPSSISISAAHR